MTLAKLLPAVTALALLGACEARIGNDAAPVAENATAENRAQEGRLTIEAPGFNLQMDIPESMRADINDDSDGMIYPGAAFGGIHVQGNRGDGRDRPDEVELRFSTGDDPARVAAWYRDPARSSEFSITRNAEENGATVIAGNQADGDGTFTLHLAPRGGGGTEARLLLTDRN
ncbi:hypothetical protein RCO27_18710 [Sphingosinicella sp. LHD-64]|uniref:hypothetical protein n=1 Tax=Sphingosinicella sp. LHD-64 TaxID=3072139 RepID=UPI00280D1C4F|nr:hypothetical protein [Sphingosinicella sp. LHD-64]MDQ8758265.1 hypothetical protein [Sphingosinicella sp. LHD-64]